MAEIEAQRRDVKNAAQECKAAYDDVKKMRKELVEANVTAAGLKTALQTHQVR